MKTSAELINQILQSLEVDDDLGLWEFVRAAQRIQPEANRAEIQQTVFDVIEQAVSTNQLWPSWPVLGGKYQPWRRPIGELLTYIAEQWDALGREPSIGEVIWFKAPRVDTEITELLRERIGEKTDVVLRNGTTLHVFNITWKYDAGSKYARVTTNTNPELGEAPSHVFSTSEVTQVIDAYTGNSLLNLAQD